MFAALAAMLALSVWSLSQTRLDLDRVCELTGPHAFSHERPGAPQQEIDTICLRHASDDDDD
jgi:hypothetical protein